jgi:hypothetical protein
MFALAVGENLGDGSDQLAVAERLGNMRNSPSLDRTSKPVTIPSTGKRDHRNIALSEDLSGRIDPVNARQSKVHQDQIGAVTACKINRFDPVPRRTNEKTRVLEDKADVRTNNRVILNREDRRRYSGSAHRRIPPTADTTIKLVIL